MAYRLRSQRGLHCSCGGHEGEVDDATQAREFAELRNDGVRFTRVAGVPLWWVLIRSPYVSAVFRR
jgi:hypothetical protein